MKMNKFLMIAPLAAVMMACGGETETTETTTEPEVVELTVDEEITQYLTENGWDGVRDASGMYVVTDSAGVGEERPVVTDSVKIFYQGFLLDGTNFDGTGEAPATFLLTDLIQGWQIGIPMFGKGGGGKLIIPSDLAYGDRDNGQIPGGSTLMFEIQLVDWVVNAAPANEMP